ncbi:MAG: GreA/GreB family elongation factor [Anaerolineales bacterium]|nr:GreA/GreB family elongation factor [Anaerolineales bacterium]
MEAQNSSAEIVVGLGSQVELELLSREGPAERLTVTLVPDEQADFRAGFLGAGTPLARALLGQPAGREVPYRVADMRAVRILAVAPAGRQPSEDVAARREAVTREAVEQSNAITAMIFASAVNTKWGDYDADGLDPTRWGADEPPPAA